MEIIKGRLSGVASINDLIKLVTELQVTKQDLLVNQVNIKSINGESILGKGNIEILKVLGYYLKSASVNGDTLSLKNQDDEIITFTPITDEDRENLNKLSEITQHLTNIDNKLNELENGVSELEEFKARFHFNSTTINY